MGVEFTLVFVGKGGVDQAREFGFDVGLFAPTAPVFFGAGGGGVQGVVFADGEQDLGVGEKLGNFIVFLVADVLGDALEDGFFAVGVDQVGAFAFDDNQRDAVDEEHNIGAAGFFGTALFDDEFIGNVIKVVFGMRPVDVIEGKAAGVAIDRLRQAGAEGQQFVDFLVGANKAIVRLFAQLADGLLEVGFAERQGAAFVVNLVVLAQPGEQDIFQEHVAIFAAAQGEGFVGGQVGATQVDEKLESGDLGDEFFDVGRCGGHNF